MALRGDGGGGCGVRGRRAARVRCGGLLTECASAPETHLKDIWDWGIGGERGGKVIVNKGERTGARRDGVGGRWRMMETVSPPPEPGGYLSRGGVLEPLVSRSERSQPRTAAGWGAGEGDLSVGLPCGWSGAGVWGGVGWDQDWGDRVPHCKLGMCLSQEGANPPRGVGEVWRAKPMTPPT